MNATAPTLPAEDVLTFPCPGCRRPHPWAPEYAGRTARCGCGSVLRVPAAVHGHSAPPPASQPVPPPPAPPANASDGVPAFLRMGSTAAAPEDSLPEDVEAELAATAKYGEEDFNKPDPRRDLHVPVALLVIGFGLVVAEFAYGASHTGAGVAAGILFAGVKLVFGMILMLGGALAAAYFAGINFGPIGPALLKLAGLCLAPSALGDLTTELLGGDMAVEQIGWVVRIVLYWVLVSYLFRLDGAQTAAVVAAITIVKIVSTVVVGSLLLFSVAPAFDGAGTDSGDDTSVSSLESTLEEAGGDDDAGDDE